MSVNFWRPSMATKFGCESKEAWEGVQPAYDDESDGGGLVFLIEEEGREGDWWWVENEVYLVEVGRDRDGTALCVFRTSQVVQVSKSGDIVGWGWWLNGYENMGARVSREMFQQVGEIICCGDL